MAVVLRLLSFLQSLLKILWSWTAFAIDVKALSTDTCIPLTNVTLILQLTLHSPLYGGWRYRDSKISPQKHRYITSPSIKTLIVTYQLPSFQDVIQLKSKAWHGVTFANPVLLKNTLDGGCEWSNELIIKAGFHCSKLFIGCPQLNQAKSQYYFLLDAKFTFAKTNRLRPCGRKKA